MKKTFFENFIIDKVKKEYPLVLEADNFDKILNAFSNTYKSIDGSLNNLYNLKIEEQLKTRSEKSILNGLYNMFISALENSDDDNKKLLKLNVSKDLFEEFIIDTLKSNEISVNIFLNLNKQILATFYLELIDNLILLDENNKRVFLHSDEYRFVSYKNKMDSLLKANLKFDNILKLENVNFSGSVYRYGVKNININRKDLFDKFLIKLFNSNYGSILIKEYFSENRKYHLMIEELGLENITKNNLFYNLSYKSLYRIFDTHLKYINLGLLSDFTLENSNLVNDKVILESILNQMPSDFKNTLKKSLIKFVNKTYFREVE